MLAFLDACTIIYWIEMAEPQYKKFTSKLHHLRERYSYFSFAASELSLLECRIKPLREKNEELLKHYELFFTSSDLKLVPISHSVIKQATSLRVLYNLPTPDAIQAASALIHSDPVIFLTADKIFKKISGLNVEII